MITTTGGFMEPFIQVVEENGKWYGNVVVNRVLIVTVTADTELAAYKSVTRKLVNRYQSVMNMVNSTDTMELAVLGTIHPIPKGS